MGWFSGSKKQASGINWTELTTDVFLGDLVKQSYELPVLLFKHSTRCGISSMVLRRFESDWDIEESQLKPVYLDLLAYRSLSDKIAREFNVLHQSPQILLIKDGTCIYDASHSGIDVNEIKQRL